jgi:hypothetical protein
MTTLEPTAAKYTRSKMNPKEYLEIIQHIFMHFYLFFCFY